MSAPAGGQKLPPEANRVLWVKVSNLRSWCCPAPELTRFASPAAPSSSRCCLQNLNYKTKGDDLYDLFGKYGAIRQIRLGVEAKTKGTAFVVYEDVMDVSRVAREQRDVQADLLPFCRPSKRSTTSTVSICKSGISLVRLPCCSLPVHL